MFNPLTFFTNKLRGFYEGGRITTANKDFYNATSPFEDTATPDRDTMRGRARWLSANNAIMDNIDNAVINNVIGNGITFQSITTNDKFNRDIEKKFKKWANNPMNCDVVGKQTFYDMQRLILKTRMVDGEIFIYKKPTKDGLQLQLIEADALDSTNIAGGIEYDSVGRPTMYHFRDVNYKTFKIKAEYIINYFICDRASQLRGISEYKQAIVDLKNFSAFQTASIQGARARANIAYTVKQGGNISNFGNIDTTNRIQSVNGVSVLYLEKGEDISKLDPDSVSTDYTQFSENTIRLIATARKVSYELAFRDYSKVNFASSRASLLQDFKRFDFEQEHLVNYILNDIFKTWITHEILKGTIKAKNLTKNEDKYIATKWIMPKRDLVDPLKEITAIEKKIKMNITCESDVASQNGEDYEQILVKKAEEIKMKADLGIPDYTLIEVDESDDSGKTEVDEQMSGAESDNNTTKKVNDE